MQQSLLTPEQRSLAGQRGGFVNKIRARALAGERFAYKNEAYKAGFQAGYQARIRYERKHQKEAA